MNDFEFIGFQGFFTVMMGISPCRARNICPIPERHRKFMVKQRQAEDRMSVSACKSKICLRERMNGDPCKKKRFQIREAVMPITPDWMIQATAMITPPISSATATLPFLSSSNSSTPEVSLSRMLRAR